MAEAVEDGGGSNKYLPERMRRVAKIVRRQDKVRSSHLSKGQRGRQDMYPVSSATAFRKKAWNIRGKVFGFDVVHLKIAKR